MKKVIAPLAFALAMFGLAALSAAPAHAKYTGGGFTGPGPALVSVQQALDMGDDARVGLKGNIVQHLGDDKYMFRDSTGTVRVEIDDDIWQGQNVGPNDVVELFGKVDKELNSVEIDVKRLVKK